MLYKDILNLCNYYYYFSCLFIKNMIDYLFIPYKFFILLPEDTFIYIIFKLYLNLYLEIIRIFFFNLFYIDLPYYIMGLILKIYIFLMEYIISL